MEKKGLLEMIQDLTERVKVLEGVRICALNYNVHQYEHIETEKCKEENGLKREIYKCKSCGIINIGLWGN